MPNLNQFAFLLSFGATFGALFLLSRLVSAQLKAHGYDISDIVLIGLPKPEPGHIPKYNVSSGTPFMDQLSSTSGAQLAAIVIGVCGALFLYLKFTGSSKPSLFTTICGLKAMSAEKTPVLDPQVWKEFPLTEKIIVSPNTAL